MQTKPELRLISHASRCGLNCSAIVSAERDTKPEACQPLVVEPRPRVPGKDLRQPSLHATFASRRRCPSALNHEFHECGKLSTSPNRSCTAGGCVLVNIDFRASVAQTGVSWDVQWRRAIAVRSLLTCVLFGIVLGVALACHVAVWTLLLSGFLLLNIILWSSREPDQPRLTNARKAGDYQWPQASSSCTRGS